MAAGFVENVESRGHQLMSTIVLLLLLGWLICTALLTISAGAGMRDRSLPTGEMVQQMTRITGPQDTVPPAIASASSSAQDIPSTPPMMD